MNNGVKQPNSLINSVFRGRRRSLLSCLTRVDRAAYSHYTSALDLLKFGLFRIFHPDLTRRALTLPEVVDEIDGQRSRLVSYADSLTDEHYNRFRN